MPNKNKILDQFRLRDGSNRAKLLAYLYENIGNQIPLTKLLDEVYGKKKGSMTAFSNVRGSIERLITSKSLPYEIVRQRTKRGLTIGLYTVEAENEAVTQRGASAAPNPKERSKGDDN